MGCCVFVNSNNDLTRESYDIIVPIATDGNQSFTEKNPLFLSPLNKENNNNLTSFPSSLIKSKDNPNGIVVIKMKY